jgi:polyisoprenoid-binding protein YceI
VAVAATSTIHPVHISAHGLTGSLEGQLDGAGRVQLDKPHHAWLSIPVEELRSGNPLQDMEMDRRMDAARFPTIDCEVDRLTDNGTGGYRASARLMVHGQTRQVEAEITLRVTSQDHVVIEIEHMFDMRDFGISPPRLLVLKVDPVVRVGVRIEARSG